MALVQYLCQLQMSPHEKAIGVCTSATEVWLKYDPDLHFDLKIAQIHINNQNIEILQCAVCYKSDT